MKFSLLKKVLVFAIILLVAGLGLIVSFARQMLYRPHLGSPSAFPAGDFVNFQVRNGDGQMIQAWWASGSPDVGAVFLCHGHGVDHTNMAGMLPFLRAAGVALLLLDFRAHGASEGDYTSIGLTEWDDLRCVLEESERRGFLATGTPLAAYGRSMGAAALINGAGHLPRIGAFILESPFADLRLIAARDIKRITGLPDNFLTDVFFQLASWWTGIAYRQNRPIGAIAEIGSRPTLLIHDGRDPRATRPDHDRLAAALPGAKALIVPGASHVDAHPRSPEVFEREFLNLLAAAGIISR